MTARPKPLGTPDAPPPDADTALPAAARSVNALGPDGILARNIPHYEDRPEQRAMAAAVDAALAEERVLLVEAGTGTGKTLAYLIPALASGKRVIVSTGTRTLQDQIARHDIPLLEALLPTPFTAVTLKGVSNYACRRKLRELGVRGPDTALARDYEVVAAWAGDTDTGDRAELAAVADDASIWPLVTNTPEARLGSRCPFYETCFVTQARRRAEKADVVLVNHHLFFADLSLRAAYPGARVLPDYDAVVFDEAHQLEDVITEHFSVRISTHRLAQLVRDATGELTFGHHGRLFAGDPAGISAVERILGHVERCGVRFFAQVRGYVAGRATRDAGRVSLAPDLFAEDNRQEAWFRLDTALDELACHMTLDAERASEGGDDERGETLGAFARRAHAFRDDLAVLAEQSADRYVYWGELRGATASLCAAPIDVSGVIRQHLLERVPTAVLTSATLTTAGSFDYVRRRLGMDDDVAESLAVASPFDYARQALLYVPRDLPDPRHEAFSDAACGRVAELVAITDGGAFVLFTSHRALKAAARRLRGQLPCPVLVQGEQPRGALLERFRARRSVLLATGAFWEGVDVPGDALSMVIIDKLPFAPHTDPLTAARMRAVEQRRGDAFHDYQVPRAALALKQGFGRLIRRRDDRGVVALLDGRAVSRTYGRAFLQSLPAGLPRTSILDQVRRWWQASEQ